MNNNSSAIAKIIFIIFKIYMLLGTIALTIALIFYIFNYYKTKNSEPPYVVEEKSDIKKNSGNGHEYKLFLKEAKNEFGDTFEVPVGHLTFDKYNIGDTIYAKIN